MADYPNSAEDIAVPARAVDKSLLFTGMVILGMGQSLMFIIIAPLAREIGMSEIQYGLSFTIANFAMVFTAPYWGRKSDTWGRRPVFIFGIAGCGLGYLLMALAMQAGVWEIASVWGVFFLLLLSRGVFAVTTPAIYSASSAYIADITDRKNRAQGMALIGGANSLGLIIGPALGGSLAFIAILFPMYFASAIAGMVALITFLHLREPERHDKGNNVKLKWNDKRILPFMAMWLTFFTGFTSLQFITAFYMADHIGITDTREIVYLLSIASLCQAVIAVAMQTAVLQVIKIPQVVLMRLCLPLFIAGLIILGSASSVPAVFVAYAMFGFSFSMAGPGFNGGMSLSVKSHEQGAAAGFVASATTLGVIIGPLVGTSLYSLAPTVPIWTSVVMLSIVGIYVFFVHVPEVQKADGGWPQGTETVKDNQVGKANQNQQEIGVQATTTAESGRGRS